MEGALPAFAEGRVGPNAVIQLGAAVTAGCGRSAAERVYARAGHPALLDAPPGTMIDEAVPRALFRALWAEMGDQAAAALAFEAGRRTADYVIAHRIPRLVTTLLRCLPSRVAAPMLIRAIGKNAWTFAGSGHCVVTPRPALRVEIAANPLAMPGCAWHHGVFARLFEDLVSADVQIRVTASCWDGAPVCRFEFTLT